MSKYNKKAKIFIILIVAAIAFSVFAFAIPFPKTLNFWFAYFAEIIALALQIPVFKLAFDGKDTPKSRFLGFPVARVGYLYLGIQTALSIALFILGFIPMFPQWLSPVLCVILICAAIAGSLGSDIVRENIETMETQQKVDTAAMENLKQMAEFFMSYSGDLEIKKELKKLCENFKFSDPVSKPSTKQTEDELCKMMEDLKNHISDGSVTSDEIKSIDNKLSQRNTICKNSK